MKTIHRCLISSSNMSLKLFVQLSREQQVVGCQRPAQPIVAPQLVGGAAHGTSVSHRRCSRDLAPSSLGPSSWRSQYLMMMFPASRTLVASPTPDRSSGNKSFVMVSSMRRGWHVAAVMRSDIWLPALVAGSRLEQRLRLVARSQLLTFLGRLVWVGAAAAPIHDIGEREESLLEEKQVCSVRENSNIFPLLYLSYITQILKHFDGNSLCINHFNFCSPMP
jgi:hypothetical protein